MRLAALDDRLAMLVDDLTAQKWGAKRRGIALNDMQRSLVRLMADCDQGFVNHRFTVPIASMRTVHADEFSCQLPPWVLKVTAVRLTAVSTEGRKRLVERANKWGHRPGWYFSASNELTFYRMGQPQSFDIECAKIPALMTKGTLPSQAGMTTSQMRLDADPALTADYPHETAQGSYAGGLFEITGPTSARVGQLLRCTGSLHDQSSIGTVLTFEQPWASVPLAGDTYEMHTEIPDQHINLLVLLAAQRLFAQIHSSEGIAAIGPELAREWDQFKRHITSRDVQEPEYIGDGPRALFSDYPMEVY